MRFLDREAELAFLERSFRSRAAQLVVLWGRRRVGKTALLERFARQHGIVYHLATRATPALELERFSRRLAEHFADDILAAQPFANWEIAFRYLARRRERPTLILDEFPYLAETDPAFPTLLQAAWDEHLSRRGARLYLCGSSVAMVERLALNQSAPLYGRRTGQWHVEPLKAWDLAAIFRRPLPDLIRVHAAVGGVPYYFRLFEPRRSLAWNIERALLEKGAVLYEEVPFLLREELREPRVYFSILASVALGAHRFGEISSKTGLDRPNITRYLAELEGLGLLKREVPITEPNPLKSRRGIYRITDPFTRFWFRFVYPNKDQLELGQAHEVLKSRVLPELEPFVGQNAESVVRDLLCDTGARRHVPFTPAFRGRYWGPEAELDVVLLDSERRRAFVAEVKWSQKPVGRELLDDLRARVARVRELAGLEICFALVSAAGFRDSKRTLAKDERLIDLTRL